MEEKDFLIRQYSINDIKGIKLTGVLVAHLDTAGYFFREIEKLYNENKDFFIDISELAFIDSYGFGAILSHCMRAKKEERKAFVLNENQDEHSFMNVLIYRTGADLILDLIRKKEEIK